MKSSRRFSIDPSSNSIPFFDSGYGGITSNGRTYFFGIIDILTEYGAFKKAENFIKKIKYGNRMSCIPTIPYSTRFKNFLQSICIAT
jgi:hypothetical protein